MHFASMRLSARQIGVLVKQSLLDPHRASSLGATWFFIQPLVYIVIYSTVFSGLMSARMASAAGYSHVSYSAYLIPGILAWNVFSGSVQATAQAFVAKAYLIKKIQVDMAVLPLYAPVVEYIVWLVSMLCFAAFCALWIVPLHAGWLMLPVLCALLALLGYGVGLILAVLGSFVPDVRPMTSIAVQLLFWMTPIVYLPELLPAWAQPFLDFHPVYWQIVNMQNIVLHRPVVAAYFYASLGLTVGVLGIAMWMARRFEKDIRDLL